jgi:phosphotransferase system enzyme I (PtsI)
MAAGRVLAVETKLSGLGVSPGIAIGTALCLEHGNGNVHRTQLKTEHQVDQEIRRLRKAIITARQQLQTIKTHVETALGAHHAYIIDAHLLMLEDSGLIRDIESLITNERVNSEWAIRVVTDRLMRAYSSIKDEYLRERGTDIEDVMNRLTRVLSGQRAVNLASLPSNVVLIAEDIPPSYAADLDFKHVLGFATNSGGWTSHTAIIARSLAIPAVVGLHNALHQAATGDAVILDGTTGEIIFNPSRDTIRYYEGRRDSGTFDPSKSRASTNEPAITQDGQTITLRANIDAITDLEDVKRYGATGIGLYRSELFMHTGDNKIPDEEEQFAEYRRIAESLGRNVASIRAFDLGGDKAPIKGAEKEPNPSLGLRGIRYLLHYPDIFHTQLRAILRASHYGRLRVVLPLVSDVAELRMTRRIIEEVKSQLRSESIPFDDKLQVGVMVEVPSAVIGADTLAREADMFSLGTNDLIQYLLGVDRINENVSYLYQPLHPTVLRAIRQTVQAAGKASIPIEVCGEMSANPAQAAMLMGLGLKTLSMTPTSIPIIKSLVRSVNLQDLGRLADELIVKCATAKEVEEYLFRELPRRFPGFFAAWMG